MAKAGELSWDELKKSDEKPHKPTALWVNDPSVGIAPKGDAFPRLAKGEIPRRPSNEEIAKAILPSKSSQPTDKELFGHLVPTEEQLKKAEFEWENKFNNHFAGLNTKLPTLVEDEEWGTCKSFNSTLSPEELVKRNTYVNDRE